jgi:DNA-binding transcriptional LysR family regulator
MKANMDLEIVKHFIVVAETLNITKAAMMLYMTQPTLSRQIQTLEKQIGVQLFYKENHNMKLSGAGKVFYEESLGLIRQMDEILKDVRIAARIQNENQLIIEVHENFVDPLTAICNGFHEKNSDVQYIIEKHTMQEIIDDIYTSKADVGCITSIAIAEYEAKTRGLGLCVIGMDPACLLVRHQHPLTEKGTLTWDELRSEIGAQKFEIRHHQSADSFKFFNRIFAKEDLPILPDRKVFDSATTTFYELQSSDFAVPGFESIGRLLRDFCATIQLAEPSYWCDILLIWDNSNENPLMKSFVDFAKAYSKSKKQ